MKLTHGRHHRVSDIRDLLLQIIDQPAHAFALQILHSADSAGDDWILLKSGKRLDIGFAAIGKRADHGIAAVLAVHYRRHGSWGAFEEEVHQKRLEYIVGMVSKRDLGASLLDGHIVEYAAPETGAERTRGFIRLELPFYYGVCVPLNDAERNLAGGQVLGDDMSGKAGLFLIEVNREQVELYRGSSLQILKEAEEDVAVLASAQADHYAVSVDNHPMVGNSLTYCSEQLSFQQLFSVLHQRSGMQGQIVA